MPPNDSPRTAPTRRPDRPSRTPVEAREHANPERTGRGPASPDEPRRTSWIGQVGAFAGRTLRATVRNRSAVIWGIGFPSVWYVLTSRLFLSVPESVPDARHAAVMAEMKAANAVSLALFGVLMVSLVVFADSLTADVEAKRYRKLRTLPVSPSADFVGRFLAATGFACVAYVVVVAVGALDGAAYTLRGPASIPVVAASLGLLSLVGLSLAVVVTHVVAQGEYVVGATNFLLLVGYFLTGFNGVVPGTVPERTRGLVNLLPNSLATRLQVYHTTDVAATGPFSPPVAPSDPVHVGLLFAWAGVLAAVAVIVMRRGIYARRGGA